MKALGKHPRIDGLVQISDGRRRARPGFVLVDRDDIREVSRGANFPECLKGQLSERVGKQSVAALSLGNRSGTRLRSPFSQWPSARISRVTHSTWASFPARLSTQPAEMAQGNRRRSRTDDVVS
jgi:hypothetical protein